MVEWKIQLKKKSFELVLPEMQSIHLTYVVRQMFQACTFIHELLEVNYIMVLCCEKMYQALSSVYMCLQTVYMP